MKLEQNLGPVLRIGYGVFGLALLVLAGVGVVSGGWRVALGLVGAVVAIEGAVGF